MNYTQTKLYFLIDVGKFEADDTDNNEKDRNESNDVVRVAKKEDAADNGARSADPCPYRIGSSDGNAFHRLRDGKEAQDNKNNGDDARDEF